VSTVTTTTVSPGTQPPALGSGGTSFARVVHSEWTKFWSVRSTMWTLLITVACIIGFGVLFSWGATASYDEMTPQDRATLDPTSISQAGLIIGQLAIAVLGALIITTEYSTGGIKTTFTAVPARLKVVFAKALVFLVVSFVVGLVSCFTAFWLGQLFWRDLGLDASLGDPQVARAVFGGALYLVGSGMYGFAVGTLLRHTAGAITTVVALLLVLPPLSNLLPGEWGDTVTKYFTSNAGQQITSTLPLEDVFAPWPGYVVFTIEWMVIFVIGAVLVRQRDA